MKYDRHTFYFVEISRGGAMTSKIFALFALLAAPISALAQMSCTALGAHLATQPNISQYVPPLPAPQVPQPFTQVIGTRCEANFIYSSRGGPPTQDNPNFPVIQATQELNYGRLDDFLRESIHQQYKWALALTEVYYGKPATRNYWDGCSTGGREGLSMALSFGQDFDGFLTGAPANFHTRLQVATVWPFWVQKELTGAATLTQAKMNAANASAVAACDEQDGLKDGILSDSRTCNFDAASNVCGQPGAPAAPNCLAPPEAQAVNRIWDGPRNDPGPRIWVPFGRGAHAR